MADVSSSHVLAFSLTRSPAHQHKLNPVGHAERVPQCVRCKLVERAINVVLEQRLERVAPLVHLDVVGFPLGRDAPRPLLHHGHCWVDCLARVLSYIVQDGVGGEFQQLMVSESAGSQAETEEKIGNLPPA